MPPVRMPPETKCPNSRCLPSCSVPCGAWTASDRRSQSVIGIGSKPRREKAQAESRKAGTEPKIALSFFQSSPTTTSSGKCCCLQSAFSAITRIIPGCLRLFPRLPDRRKSARENRIRSDRSRDGTPVARTRTAIERAGIGQRRRFAALRRSCPSAGTRTPRD